MSTPLYISNGPAIELRNIMKHLQVGAHARYEHLEGNIEFVCDEYVTICVASKPNPPGSKQPTNKCCVCVYQQDWGEIEVEPIKQYGKSYSGTTNDHPGNEMLPSVDER
tara:strand:- start:6565 stop:6891 length:327 start_codon:yes stop_codon:yes gene_type:complete